MALRAPAQNDRESEILSDGRGNHAWKSLPETMQTGGVLPADFKVLRLEGEVPLHGYGGRWSTSNGGLHSTLLTGRGQAARTDECSVKFRQNTGGR